MKMLRMVKAKTPPTLKAAKICKYHKVLLSVKAAPATTALILSSAQYDSQNPALISLALPQACTKMMLNATHSPPAFA